jgi:hypothetical protein
MGFSIVRRAAALAAAVAVTFACAVPADAAGECAPISKTGADGRVYRWTPGKT